MPLFRSVLLSFLPAFVLVLLCGTSLGHAQSLETYQQKKEQEKGEPNRFLRPQALEQPDQIGKYYRRAFSEQKSKSARIAPMVGTGDQLGTSGLGGVFEGPVDPSAYHVGPGDILAISIWGDAPLQFTTTITPEGSALLPTIGEADLRGLSLAAAKTAIATLVRRKFSKGEVGVTLLAPRTFLVHVSGRVPAPGAYAVQAGDRVDKAVTLAHIVESSDATSSKPSPYAEDPQRPTTFSALDRGTDPSASLRTVLIRRGNSVVRADLLRYYATGDLRANPLVRDGDVIVLQPERIEGNSVSVSGAVRLPGSFEFAPGDSLGFLLQIAQGLTEGAMQDSVQILRVGADGMVQSFLVDAGPVLNGVSDIALHPNDRILVRERRAAPAPATVSIRGEVRFPGAYPITREKTTISQVLLLAGGLTPEAAPAEALVLRRDPNVEVDPLLAVPDYLRLRDMRLSELNKEEREYFTYESTLRRSTVSVDLPRALAGKDKSADVILRDGDEIVIPSSMKSVYVFGQVARPGYVTHVSGMDEDWYLERAGGVSDAAVTGDIKIIKAGSKNWVDPGDTAIEPGDAIWVPRQPDRDFLFWFTAARDFLQVSVSIATVYLLIQQIRNN